MGRLAVALCAAVIGWQIFVPPITGLANNADFGKLLDWFHYKGDPEDEYKFVQTKFEHDPTRPNYAGERSSGVILAAIAIAVNRALFLDRTLDLRAIGLVHFVLFLSGVWILSVRPRFRQLPFLALMLVILTDAVYATMLNSFYEDAAAMVFLLVALALAWRVAQEFRVRDAILCAIAAALAAATKDQHCLLALPFAAFLVWECARAGRRRLAIALALLIAAAGASMWIGKAKYHANNGFSSVVFHRILPASSDADRDMRELGLGAEYRVLIGKTPFDEGWKIEGLDIFQLQDKLARDRSFPRLALFYARHPSQAMRGLLESLSEAGRQRTGLGNFTRSAGRPPYAETERWAIWSNLKRAVLMEHGVRYLIWLIALGLILLVASRGTSAALLMVSCTILELLVTSLADALEIARHMFVFNFLCDLMLLTALRSLLAGGRASGKT